MSSESTPALHARRVEILAELRTDVSDARADELEAQLAELDRLLLNRIRYLGMAR